MRPKIFSLKLFLASFVLILTILTLTLSVSAETCAPGITPAVCPSGTFCRPCEPPTLQGLEVMAVQIIGIIWVMTGLIFFGLFIYNSYLYMFNKVEDSKKRMTQWIIGLIMILFAQPVVATIMKFIIADGSACYEELRQPSFTFFFPNVCDSSVSPSPIVIPSGTWWHCTLTGSQTINCYKIDDQGNFLMDDGITELYCNDYDQDPATGCYI